MLSYHAEAQTDKYQQAFSEYQNQNFHLAENIWLELANQGDINAQYALGVMHTRKETEKASAKKAFKWFQKAASKGHTTAMFNVGVAYWDGRGIAQDREEALLWWEKSAKAGDSGAQFNLGYAYYIGDVRSSNIELASKWIGMAARQNHPEAQRIQKIMLQEFSNLASNDLEGELDGELESEQEAGLSDDSADEIVNEVVADVVDNTQQELATTETTSQLSNELVNTNQADPLAEPSTSVEEVQSSSTVELLAASEVSITNEYWRVIADSQVHVSPDSSAPAFENLPTGAPIEVVSTRDNWSQVTLPAGLKTWVYGQYLDTTGKSGVVTGTGVRVRTKPSTDNAKSPSLGAYRDGDQVELLATKGEWYQVRAPKHIGGWIENSKIENYQDSENNREKLWQAMKATGL